MAKPKGLEAWGRAKARERYAAGGDVEDMPSSDSELEPQSADRSAEVDEFISRVMQDQIKKMEKD